MDIAGFSAAIMMGLSLGLIGGGGSILTVPILVYMFGIDPVLSTSYSLFVVGLTSLIGSFTHFKAGNVDLKTALLFGLPSVFSVYSVRKFVLPIIPDPLFHVGTFTISKALFMMMLFAALMLLVAISMISKPGTESRPVAVTRNKYPAIFAEGLFVGAITGLVGAGGGFLIIPALVLFAGLPMKKAVGTSLIIIAFKSLIGFTGDLGSGLAIDYTFLLYFSTFSVVGIAAGTYLSFFIANEKLKPAFGWFVLVMGFYILGSELLF